MDVYRSRHKPRPGAISRHVRLSLLPEEWAVYERLARYYEVGMAYTITERLAMYAALVCFKLGDPGDVTKAYDDVDARVLRSARQEIVG